MKTFFKLLYIVMIGIIVITSAGFSQTVQYKIGDNTNINSVQYEMPEINWPIILAFDNINNHVFQDIILVNLNDTITFISGQYNRFISVNIFKLLIMSNPLPILYSVENINYSYSLGNGNDNFTNSSDNIKFTTDNPGDYYLVFITNDGFYEFIKIVVLPEGIYVNIESNSITSMQLYPNPVIDYVDLEFESTTASEINLISSLGKVLETKQSISGFNKMRFDLSVYPQGVYFIRIGNETRRIIKQ